MPTIRIPDVTKADFSKEDLAAASLSRVYNHTMNRNIGMITAHRGDLSPEENKKRNEGLKHEIRKHFGYIPVHGSYVENKGTPHERHVKEHSFLVIGKKGHDAGHLKGFLKQHGEKYGQDSVLYKPHDDENAHLIGTNDTPDLKKGESVSIGKWHPNRTSDYMSKLRKSGAGRARTFVFGGDSASVQNTTDYEFKYVRVPNLMHLAYFGDHEEYF
jgi:hypothetical protein